MNHNRNFLLCLHLAIISFLEFISRGTFDLRIISTFSVVHRSQYFLPFLYGLRRLTISHFIVYGVALSFRVHTASDSLVAFLY